MLYILMESSKYIHIVSVEIYFYFNVLEKEGLLHKNIYILYLYFSFNIKTKFQKLHLYSMVTIEGKWSELFWQQFYNIGVFTSGLWFFCHRYHGKSVDRLFYSQLLIKNLFMY
jgi:hypothetical protein